MRLVKHSKIALKQFLLIATCAGAMMTQTVVADETGESRFFDTYKNWFSAELCFSKYCVWRAGTLCKEVPDNLFLIDKLKDIDNIYIFSLHSTDISQASLLSWGKRTEDKITVKVRVDKGKVRELVAERTLNKAEKTIYWILPITDQDEFLKELQKGTTLRLRAYNETPVTLSFSLSGAYAVIERMQTENYKEERRQKAINSDPYFKDEL